MSKKVSKKNAIDFLNRVTNILKEHEAIEAETQTSYKKYKLNTNAGELNVTIEDLDSATESSIYTIYTCFEDHEKAREFCECNRFTGKYNFHNNDKEDCIINFENFLTKITA